jgi:hypothetical protein
MKSKSWYSGLYNWLYYIFVEFNVLFKLVLVGIPVFFVLSIGELICELASDGWEQQELIAKQGTLDDVPFSLNVPIGLSYSADAFSAGWQEDIGDIYPLFYIEVTQDVLPPSGKKAISRLISRHETDVVVVEASCEPGGCQVTTKRDDDGQLDVYVYRTRTAPAKKGSDPEIQTTLRCYVHLERTSGFTLGNIDGAITYLKRICGSLKHI